MAGSCWRLLAALSLIFGASAFLRGQNVGRDRAPMRPPDLPPPRYSPPLAPIRSPVSPGRAPGGHDPVGRHPTVPSPVVLQQMAGAAGIIFSGRVIFIGHAVSSSGQNPASTAVTFQVEHAMRGASPDEKLTIHEWSELWSNGERYFVGEEVLLFLYPPGKLGLSSPVAGPLGRFAMDSQGNILMSPQHVAILAADPILGGKAVVSYADFALAVERSGRKE